MWKAAEGSTARLIQLCVAYFAFYVLTGVIVKYFQFYPGGPELSDIQYLTYSTLGGILIAVGVVLALRWYKMKSARLIHIGKFSFPSELSYIIPAGFCTAIVITFTTLMYSFKGVSVMVAMVLMRGCIIMVGRLVDAIQIKQKILHRKVYWQENVGVLFAVLAVCTNLLWVKKGEFDFLTNPAAMFVLCTYVGAYALRIYIMNYFKNTRPSHIPYDNKGYFALEQISSTIILFIAAIVIFYWPHALGGAAKLIQDYRATIIAPPSAWGWAILGGTAFGMVSFFSVFIFMYKGRTATFAGLVNRLTSLIAGTAATLLCWLFLDGKFPILADWISLLLILVAIGFMTASEKRRVKELIKEHELPKSSQIIP